jgi:hypothetical protein
MVPMVVSEPVVPEPVVPEPGETAVVPTMPAMAAMAPVPARWRKGLDALGR